jgi:hypothetical protein
MSGKSNNFEISLVPAVKAKLLHQERIRNLVVFACIIVAIGCGVLVAILFATTTALKLKSSNLDTDIACRIDSTSDKLKGKKCKGGKVAIMQTANLNEMLSIQNELNSIGSLNSKKTKPSRLLPTSEQLSSEPGNTSQAFSMLEIALPSDAEYEFQTSEFNIDFDESTISYDVVAHAVKSSAQATAYINYKYSINGSYYDKGEYMRTNEDGSTEAIPTYCITSEKIIEGEVYGVYNRYAPGCEAPMVNKTTKTDENSEEGEKQEKVVYHEVDPIYIRRSYSSSDDFENYKGGSARSKNGEIISFGEAPKGFYFESSCIQYGDDGKFDEDATRSACPVATEVVEGTDKKEARDEETGRKTMSFSVVIPFSEDIFSQSSHHVLFFYPSRKTVSTSYRAIEDFFTAPIEDAKPVEDK